MPWRRVEGAVSGKRRPHCATNSHTHLAAALRHVRDEEGVLHLGGTLAVHRDGGPAVLQDANVVVPLRQDGFNGEHEAGLHHRAAVVAEVQHLVDGRGWQWA